MTRTGNKKGIIVLLFIFGATYFTSYMTRNNYSTVLTEIITDTGYSKEILSLALTGSFFTYGLGQVISGVFGDLFSPKKLLACGLVVTACGNLLIPLCTQPWQMILVWSMNGLAQAFMWPPLVKLMTVVLPAEDYHRGVMWASCGGNIATVLLYLISPLMIGTFGWRSMFWLGFITAVVMLVFWLLKCPDPGRVQRAGGSDQAVLPGGKKLLYSPVMLAVMAAIILHGILRDGVASWMPEYIKVTYNTSNELAILSGVLMPVFSLICLKLGTVLYKKRFTNPLACATVMFGFGAVCALLLPLLGGRSAVGSILLMALLTGSMHGVNLMLISTIPPFFKKYGMVSTASGVLNACTYVGSAVSTYGIAVLSESKGWFFTLWMWVAVAIAGGTLCLLAMRPFKKKMQ